MLAAAMVFRPAACSSNGGQSSAGSDPSHSRKTAAQRRNPNLRGAGDAERFARYSDDDTMLPYDYAVERLAEEMPWVTLELDAMPADDGVTENLRGNRRYTPHLQRFREPS